MKQLITFLLLTFTLISQGQIQFQNPSFELGTGTNGLLTSRTATNWPFCNGSTDVEPGVFVNKPASQGVYYLGFWDGGGTTYAGITPKLGEGTMQQVKQNGVPCALVTGKTYTFELDIKAEVGTYSAGEIAFIGGFAQCTPSKLFWRSSTASPAVTQDWQRYTITFTADQAYSWIGFYAVNRTGNEDVQIDNLSVITKSAGTLTTVNAKCTTAGSATFTTSGPGGPYEYKWFNAGNATPFQTGSANTVTNLVPGNYSVEVRDLSESCPVPVIKTFTITGTLPIQGNASVNKTTVCEGENIQLDFTLTIPRTVNYSWTGPGLSNPAIKNPTALPNGNPNTYEITVTDPNDATCVLKETIVVNRIVVNAGTDASLTLCKNSATVDLFTKLGGTPDVGGSWTNPGGTAFTNPLNPATAAAGAYTYTVSKGGCPSKSAKVTVTINSLPIAGTDGATTVCNTDKNLQLFPLLGGSPQTGGTWSSTPGTAGLNANGTFDASKVTPNVYNLKYQVNGTAPCPNASAQVVVTVKALPIANFNKINAICANYDTVLTVNITGGTAPYTLVYNVGGNITTQNVTGNSFNIPININNSTNYQISSIADQGSPACTNDSIKTILVPISVPPVLSLDSSICNNTATGFRAYLTLSGGDPATYKINGTSVAGTKYTSAEILPNQEQAFTLTDKNGCLPLAVVKAKTSCNCISDAGTIATTVIKVCGSVQAIASPNNDLKKDGNDNVVFVLHDNPGTSLGTIYEVSLTPDFTYDANWGIIYGNTYYISRVVGDGDASKPGFVDFSDPSGCMKVAAGQPVIFNETPALSALLNPTQICRGQSTNLEFNFTAGKENYTVLFTDGTTNFTANNLSNSANKFTITPTAIGSINYTLNSVSDINGCVSGLSQILTLIVVDSPDTTARVITCNGSNTEYTVSFDISQGDVPSYTVNNVSNGPQFTSAVIKSGDPYSFVVDDINNCKPLTIAGSHTCPCITGSGQMVVSSPNNVLEFCVTTPAIAQHNGLETLDDNDVLSFILCTDPLNPTGSGSFLAMNDSAVFPFTTSLQTGVVYYIVPIAGDSNLAGLYDVNAVYCSAFGNTQRIKFLETPTVGSISKFEICEGEQVNLEYTVTGDPSKQVNFSVLRSDGATMNESFTPGVKKSIAITPLYSFAVNDSLKYAIDPSSIRYAGTPACVGALTGDSIRIKINPSPKAQLSGSFIICDGDSINLPYTTTGNGDIQSTFSGVNLKFNSETLPAGNHLFTASPAGAGTYTYTISSLTSKTSTFGTTTCNGIVSGNITVTVRPTPTADIEAVDSIICLNDLGQIKLSATGAGTLKVNYSFGTSPAKTILIPNGTSVLENYPSLLVGTSRFRLLSVTDTTVSASTGKACSATYTKSLTILVNPLPTAALSGNTEICRGESSNLYVAFQKNGPFTYTYGNGTATFGPFTSNSLDSIKQTPLNTTSYQLLTLTDHNGCKAPSLTDVVTLVVNDIPVPDFSASLYASCPPLVTTFTNTTTGVVSGQCAWNFGDGTSSSSCDPQAKSYVDDKTYEVSLQVISDKGCVGIAKKDKVTVHPFPVADFSWDPQVPSNLTNSVVTFFNQSQDAGTFNWNISTLKDSLIKNFKTPSPIYDFSSNDSATYKVNLIATSNFGCTDTVEKNLRVTGELIVHIPNSFTPNNDGVNDLFMPIMNGFVPLSYELYIFNRWGELVFETKDYKEGWNGTINGVISKSDTYVYKMKVRSKYDAASFNRTGTISILD